MAYLPSNILTATYQALGASISADASKESAMKKEIQSAYVECVTIMGSQDVTGDIFNLLWMKLGMYRAGVIAVGVTNETTHLYKVFTDYLEAMPPRTANAGPTTTEPSWS